MRLLVTDEAVGLEPFGVATERTTAALLDQNGSDPAGKSIKRLS
ncbi:MULTISPECIES: hypothetical protein [Pseudomonas]|uniref:Uncharacterized protein n=5 Tax=Pseudomonas syringae group TaxID=136849 RepID=A0A0Q0CYN0_PSESX|nr:MULTISPECIES: hypothetical protein [Pseudomonas]KPX71345.1 hypothetical protein ALO84_102122 [Pseudomonas syringae pv. maculicola]KPY99286.1 hypothetical protein ALO94_100962 [Pseudomonas syringae pv. spinaceae]KPW35180.1 hypothetical protein ALO87_102368 [Pseudomonas syringae pv. apii]KPW48095.1 hypothetical protein ALO88_102547 [Pseudomonas syringae pv. antirrhini]KPW55762.1 hypothetical protein ALO86_102081 [Pseudomonas syringae pv. berberidis]